VSKARTKKRKERRTSTRKPCYFCKEQIEHVDYKNSALLMRFMNDRGKIAARRVTGTCARHQRVLTAAIRRARILALVPFVREYYR
jgi:small subunit ribosomal protein S18